MANARGMIAVDKMGGKVLFLDPTSYRTEVVIDGFPRTVHELLIVPETGMAYVPIFGDGVHGRNPNPQHLLLPGMFVRGQLSQGIQARGILVPQRAVGRDERGRPTVLVVGPKSMSELRVAWKGRMPGPAPAGPRADSIWG